MLLECTSELDINISVFLTIKSNNENMYCEWSGAIFNFLNISRQHSVFPAFIIILIIPFCILKIVLL
jgi:hypothetical protein